MLRLATMSETATKTDESLADKPGAWVDLGLTLPIFVLYHLAVIFLDVKNATDMVTGHLFRLADGSTTSYVGITLAIGIVFAGIFAFIGRGHAFEGKKFVQIAIEGVTYAVLMRLAAGVLMERIFAGQIPDDSRFVGFTMSLGAGFYEELAFRVLLFGIGTKVLLFLFSSDDDISLVRSGPTLTVKGFCIALVWAIVSSAIFSGFHYVGAMGDTFKMTSFVFRLLLGLALTMVYATRGFAAAVWTHAVYDIWVLVFR